ncbi:thiamine pyrophosphate-binding protein [Alphaproteobacteria bacterium]|nr:thiamine pyrophosphate-binding protein [Alphaproteobacteria bacterium]
MINADLIVATLKSAGVTHGFGIPSGNVLPLMESMRKGGIEFVLTAHEGSAGFAADVTGRLTGVPGLCIATLGPGATNLATGVGNAWLDRSPMIAITCNLNTDQLGRRIQMYIDHHALFAPITKATLAMRHDNVAQILAKAIHIATSEPRGPVHIDLPEDVAMAEAIDHIPNLLIATGIPAASDDDIGKAIDILQGANRPIAILGSTAMRIDDNSALQRFVEHHNLPFMTTTMAKGLIDDDHPLALGCIERGCRQHQRALLHSADLIVGLGYDTIEVEYEAWIDDVPLLQIDIDTVDVIDSVRLCHEVTGDLESSLERLCQFDSAANNWTTKLLDSHRAAFQNLLRPESAAFVAHQAIDAVRAALPHDGILTFDVGAHTHQIASQWQAHAPKTFLITNGWSSMGFGLPSAIAAKLARPNLPVVCMIGDGCFQMTCGELATAKRIGITLPVVVLDDRWLGLIRVKQTRRQLGIYGTELQEEDYRDPPEHYFGVPAKGARTPEDVTALVREALARTGPTVIEAVVNSDHYMETVFD